MPAVVADTHAAAWYLLDSPKLSRRALEQMSAAADAGEIVRDLARVPWRSVPDMPDRIISRHRTASGVAARQPGRPHPGAWPESDLVETTIAPT